MGKGDKREELHLVYMRCAKMKMTMGALRSVIADHDIVRKSLDALGKRLACEYCEHGYRFVKTNWIRQRRAIQLLYPRLST